MNLAFQFFFCTVAIILALGVAVAAVIGFVVLAHVGKVAYDERQQIVWKNEPPSRKQSDF
jgi:hypothetical protein